MKKILVSAALALVLMLTGCAKAGNSVGSEPVATTGTEAAAFDYSAGLDKNGYFEGVTATDYVQLPEYKGITVPASVTTVDEDEVSKQVGDMLAENATTTEVYDRKVEDGDTLNIDYVGSVDGKTFEGGNTNGAGTDVTIGLTSYIDDFLEQLIGHMPGENFNIEVTFPDSYPQNEDLAGKDAVFNVTINCIKESETPTELTDEIAANYGFDTKEAMIEDIEKWVLAKQASNFMDTVIEASVVSEIPDALLNYLIDSELNYYQNYATSYGVDLDTFFSTYVGYDSQDAYIEQNLSRFNTLAKRYLEIQAIAELEGLKATDSDVKDHNMTSYVSTYGDPYVRMYLLQEFVVPAFIVDNGIAE